MTQQDRDRLIRDFLDAHGWGMAQRRRLAGDASFRRYERLHRGSETAVLMDAPPPHEDVRPFAAVARHLVGLGFSAPEIFAEDAESGLLLIEDLGDDTFTRLIAVGADETELYELATDVLIDLHLRETETAIPDALEPYDTDKLLEEASLLTDWWAPSVFGGPLDAAAREAYAEAWRQLFPLVHGGNRTLVLRDYHVDNLIRLKDRTGVAACGLLDFQDAVVGHPAYDLVSLLEDARRDVSEPLAETMLARYFGAFPNLDRVAFLHAYAVLGAQRHAKVIGIFTRLCVRDGKAQYLWHIPRVWRMLERALANPVLAPVAAWMDDTIPKDRRGIPPVDADRGT